MKTLATPKTNVLHGMQTEYAAALAGSRTGFLATISWIILGLESIVNPVQRNIRDLYWMIPFLLTAITFYHLHRVQRAVGTSAERIGFYMLIISMTLVWLGNVGLLIDQPLLAAFSFPWGALLWMASLITYGIITLKAGILPRNVGWAIILLEPLSLLFGLSLSTITPLLDRGAYSAGVEKGMAVFVVAWGLHSLARRFKP